MDETAERAIARQTLRDLLLPIPVDQEQAAIDALLDAGKGMAPSMSELRIKVRLDLSRWESTQGVSASSMLRRLVNAVLVAAWNESQLDGPTYFRLHKMAMTAPDQLDHMAARLLLTNLPLIENLACVERSSAAQICRILAASKRGSSYSWKVIKGICVKLRWYREMDGEEFEKLFEKEAGEEAAVFIDSDLLSCIGLVADTARRFGCNSDLATLLTPIFRPGGVPSYAIVEVLHYQLSIVEFLDHAPTYIYEFAPRGKVANWMHSRYPESIVTGKQAFLNIAKSVYRITEGWALSKDKAADALALARLLRVLEDMGYPERREVSKLIRLLIHRILKQHAGSALLIPETPTFASIERILRFVANAPSETRGILEQRIVDVQAQITHPPASGWKASAIGCSVNATNRSGLRFGDCEFLNPTQHRIHAYEAHAGELTDIYFEDHLDSLQTVVPIRRPALALQMDLESISCTVTFVAHGFDRLSRAGKKNVVIAGIPIEFQFIAFEEFAKGLRIDDSFAQHWRTLFTDPLNNRGDTLTPQDVRDCVIGLLDE